VRIVHAAPDNIVRVHKPTDFLDRRRELMGGWASFLIAKPASAKGAIEQ